MRNIRHGARVQLGKHLDRLLACGPKASCEFAELAVGHLLELAPKGAKIKVVEAVAVSLVQRQQLRQRTCSAQLGSELPRIECSRVRPPGSDSGGTAV